MSITLRYTNSRGEAVEVLNDAFMKVYTNIAKYNTDRPFKPWLRKIIVNTAINHYHRTQSKVKKTDFESIEHKHAQKEEILSGISYDEIIEMVQQLSPAYRTVFNLYVIEGFKHKEIADMLGIAVGTSKSNLSKAKKNLQAIIEKSFI